MDITIMNSLRLVFLFLIFIFVQYVAGTNPLCTNETQKCTTQVLGQSYYEDSCTVEYYSSEECKSMNFGPIASNTHIGGVRLKPDLLVKMVFNNPRKYPVLNISFSNIKWKTMKFRFQVAKNNHCRNIVISNDANIDDQSVLYYDCYEPSSVPTTHIGQSHILDFEASDDNVINRGRYYFNVPNALMLNSSVTARQWKPFVYLEILSDAVRLHITAPPERLNKIDSYLVKVMKECKSDECGEEIVKKKVIKLTNYTEEVSYDYSLLGSPGSYYFKIEPLHDLCKGDHALMACQNVDSPRFTISNNAHTINICIASVSALIVAALFAYYIALRLLRRYWCKDYKLARGHDIPSPTKVLVIYSPENRLHAECVSSFVHYLRSEFGFEIMYDCDISSTSNQDPRIWASEAFKIATHVMYIVGPSEVYNNTNNFYGKQQMVSVHKNLDHLLLSLLRVNRGNKIQKSVINVKFEHSNGEIPDETKSFKVYKLLDDWNKLIAYLSKNLLPKKQIMRSERGKCFMDDLNRAKKLLGNSNFDV